MKTTLLPGLLLAASALPVFAQSQEGGMTAVETAQSEEYGTYLTTADGETLYLFINEEQAAADEGPERMTEGVRDAAAPCSGGCLDAWPPVTAEQVQAGQGVDGDLLYTAEIDGRTQVVYNGWPLYLFARDEQPGAINGQGLGQAPTEWYIVSPQGMKIEDEAA